MKITKEDAATQIHLIRQALQSSCELIEGRLRQIDDAQKEEQKTHAGTCTLLQTLQDHCEVALRLLNKLDREISGQDRTLSARK